MNHPAPAVDSLASATSAPIKSTARLEQHLGVVTAAVAATIGAALREEFKNGAVSAQTKKIGAETTAELVKMYFFMVAKFDFDRIARERGVETLVEGDLSSETAAFLINEALKLLKRVLGGQLN